MSDYKVEQFLVVARFDTIIRYVNSSYYCTTRSIGTFARALLDGAKKPQISLRLGAAAASRDITLVSVCHYTCHILIHLCICSFMLWRFYIKAVMT